MSKLKGDPGYRGGWCIHYRSIRGESGEHVATCEVGVRYDSFRREDGKMMGFQPCFLTKDGQSKEGACHCDHLRRPTPEEISAHEEWSASRMRRLFKVLEAIAPWRKENKGRSASTIMTCPICEGRLHLSIAAYNGHVHGKCETEDCVAWME